MLFLILDGVLVSASWKGLFEAYKAIIKAEGKDYRDFFKNLKEFEKWWTPDWRKNNRKIGLKNPDKSHGVFYDIYDPYCYLYPWAEIIAKKLSERHLLAIFTNRHRESADPYIAPIKKYFFIIIGGGDIKKLKPDPEGVNMILVRTGATREESLFIGDTTEDILAGKAAGIKTGAAKWGLGDWKKLLELNPDYVFKKWKDLLGLL